MTSNKLEIFEAAVLLHRMNRRAGNDKPLTVEITFKDERELSNFMREIKTSREWIEIVNMSPMFGQIKTETAYAYGMSFTYHGITFFLIA